MRNAPLKLSYFISASFTGEVDWALPILYYLYQKKGVEIKALLTRNIFKQEVVRSNAVLARLLSENTTEFKELFPYLPYTLRLLSAPLRYLIFCENYVSQLLTSAYKRIIRPFLIRHLDQEKIKIDFAAPVIAGVGHFFDLFGKEVKKVNFMDGASFIPPKDVKATNVNPYSLKYENFDYGHSVRDTNRYFFGIPKLDQEWCRILQTAMRQSANNIRARHKDKNIFVLFERDPRPGWLSKDTYDYLVRSTIDVVTENKKNVLLIKTHPRSGLKKKRLGKKVGFVDDHPTALAMAAKAVIAMNTSACLDAVLLAMPVIDFFIFDETHDIYPKDSQEVVANEFRQTNLVTAASSRKELSVLVNMILNNGKGAQQMGEVGKQNLEKGFCRTGIMRAAAEKIFALLSNDKQVDREVEHETTL